MGQSGSYYVRVTYVITTLFCYFLSHYHIVVILLPAIQAQDDLGVPNTQFDSIDDFDVYSESFCDQEFSSAKAYVTAEFGAGLLPPSGFFIVGGQGPDAPNNRPYNNGFLCYSKRYVFFVRAYTLTGTQQNAQVRPFIKISLKITFLVLKRQARQTANRQYDVFSSSPYYASTTIGLYI